MHFTTNETVSITMKANADLPAAVFNAVSTGVVLSHSDIGDNMIFGCLQIWQNTCKSWNVEFVIMAHHCLLGSLMDPSHGLMPSSHCVDVDMVPFMPYAAPCCCVYIC